jgi:pilus assembly protein CpaB
VPRDGRLGVYMRAKSMALLMLALGCGLIASIGITQVLAKRHTESPRPTGDTIPIFVTVKDVPLGDPLAADELKLESWPKDKVPAGALSTIADVEGRRTRQKLYAGEPILENKLLSKGASAQGASAVIPKGYRVVAVKVDSVSGSGLILPGDRVDVLVYLVSNPQRDIPETSTRTVLQDVKVFAVNDVVELDNDKDGKDKSMSAKTISLLVTPAQAAKVTLASEMGKIRLVMRSPEDDTHAEDATARPDELFGRSAFANRNKEEAGKRDYNGLLEYINKMKAELAANQKKPSGEEPQSTVTWTMRILQPDGVNDVVLEAENPSADGNSSPGQWRISDGGFPAQSHGKSAPKRSTPTKKDLKPATPPALPPITHSPAPSSSTDAVESSTDAVDGQQSQSPPPEQIPEPKPSA